MRTPASEAKARQIEVILGGVDALPTLSPIATRLLALGAADTVDVEEISRLIESDPSMSARILGLCRRADKGLGDRITSVKRAIVMLGIEAVRAAALSVSVYDLMKTPSYEGSAPDGESVRFDRVGFWRYSIATACAAELIASRYYAGRVAPEEAFVAGLLHALGKLVLEVVLPRAYARVLALAERQGSDSAPLEREVMGLDHHTAGKRVAEHWELPPAVQDVMWLHGQPDAALPDEAPHDLIACVTMARAVVRHLHLGWSGDYGPIPPIAALGRQLGLVDGGGRPLVRADEIATRLHEEMSARLQAIGVEETTSPQIMMESLQSANRQLARVNVTLEERAHEASARGKVLDAITDFHHRAHPGRTMSEVLGEVVRSAAALFGGGFYSLLYQPRDEDPWTLYQFAPDGPLARSEAIEPPGRDPRTRSLAVLCDTTQLSAAAMALLPWLADYLVDAVDLRKVRLLPITTPAQARHRRVPAVVLLFAPQAEGAVSVAQAGALVASWGAVVAAAARQEESRRLGERLADTNRSLVEAQSKLTEAQAMAKLGEVTAGAAHEMNNPLTVISGNAQMLALRLEDAKDQSAAALIARAAEDLSGLISMLHLIATPPKASIGPVDLVASIRAGIALARSRGGEIPQVEVVASRAPAHAMLDSEMFAGVISELVRNAAEAHPAGPISVIADAAGADLVVRVVDKGPGPSPRALVHAFDPFFSEKPAGRSKGLGLTRARSLAEAFGGSLRLARGPDGGAIATLTIPGSAAPAEAQDVRRTDPARSASVPQVHAPIAPGM